MYRIINNKSVTGESFKSIIRANDDGSFTSFLEDNNNTDYQEYLKWLEAGNEPLPAEEQ